MDNAVAKKFIETQKGNGAVNMYLISGIKLTGTIVDADDVSLLFTKKDSDHQLIMLSAVAAIQPITNQS